jgi:hypothetical protein
MKRVGNIIRTSHRLLHEDGDGPVPLPSFRKRPRNAPRRAADHPGKRGFTMKRWVASVWVASGMLSLAGMLSRAEEPPRPIRALLVLGGCCHDYAHQKDVLTRGISQRARVEWTVAYDPDTAKGRKNPVYDNPDWARGFDVIVHDECTSQVVDGDSIETLLERHRDGLPAVATARRAGRRRPHPGCN